MSDHGCTRRRFLERSAGCAAHVAWMSMTGSAWARRVWAQERFPVVAAEPWGRLEQVAEGIWALVSDPMSDRTTLCNGGIVAGRAGVVLVESFASDAGARWMAGQARRLTGRSPTHVLVTHYHGDHTGGLRGAVEGAGPVVLATAATRNATLESNSGAPTAILGNATAVDTRRPTEIDLGDRSLIVVPRRGHTDSDVTVEVTDPSVVFCGDLVWNGMFPNYMDAIPTRLSQNVRLIQQRGRDTTFVPGHGPLADSAALAVYADLLDHVGAAARDAVDAGKSAREAGAEYRLPAGLEDWTLFNAAYFERAIGAWMRELGADRGGGHELRAD